MKEKENARRSFIKKTALAGAGIAVGSTMTSSAKSYAAIKGANERVNIAVIGIRGQGGTHISSWCTLKDNRNVNLKTLCDVDESLFAEKANTVAQKTGTKPKTEWDMRKVFEDKDIHAVSFATPNYWHALGTIWACQAGKHVYVEKPASHNIWEGRKMIEAARKYNRLVQVGFQNRSFKGVQDAIKFIHEGGIGEVYSARGLCIKPRDPFGVSKDSAPPASLHYDNWLGPVSYRPYNEKKGHYNWHWYWDTGNGDTGNQGPHQFDVARWGLNKNEHPVSVYSTGGIYGWNPKECAQETPNMQSSLFRYQDGTVLEFETRGGYSNAESGLDIRIGNIFYDSEGYLEINGSSWSAFRKRETTAFAGSKSASKAPADPRTPPGGTEHYANFIDAIRSGKVEALNCDINEGHYSSSLPFLANISYRLGRELKFMGGDRDFEKFVNDPEADALLTRAYRPPYVVPDQV